MLNQFVKRQPIRKRDYANMSNLMIIKISPKNLHISYSQFNINQFTDSAIHLQTTNKTQRFKPWNDWDPVVLPDFHFLAITNSPSGATQYHVLGT